MNFFDLDATNLLAYLKAQRDFSGLWFFHHIPKTAGSSLAAELSIMAAPYGSIVWEQAGSMEEAWNSREAAAHDFEKRLTSEKVRSASGHLLARHVNQFLAAQPQMRCFTFLRHPVKRVVSEYFYCRSELHPPHQAFRETYPTLEAYIDDPNEQNKAAQYLLPDLNMSWDDSFSFIKSRYQMIGLQERYPVSFLMLTGMLSSMKPPEKNERVSPEKHQIEPQLIHKIAQVNSIDLSIYNATENVYERISEEIWKMHQNGSVLG
jgi:hypothetical protein